MLATLSEKTVEELEEIEKRIKVMAKNPPNETALLARNEEFESKSRMLEEELAKWQRHFDVEERNSYAVETADKIHHLVCFEY